MNIRTIDYNFTGALTYGGTMLTDPCYTLQKFRHDTWTAFLQVIKSIGLHHS
ncbi:hypothetical protein Hanom_Chr15g01345111 [Helianthus anomalus]